MQVRVKGAQVDAQTPESDIKRSEPKDQLTPILNKIGDFLQSYIEQIHTQQAHVTEFLTAEYGNKCDMDITSVSKLARITSMFTSTDAFQRLKAYPKGLQKYYTVWQDIREKVRRADSAMRQKAAKIPAKMAFCYFYSGEIGKAVACVLEYLLLWPTDLIAQQTAIMWLMFLGETENVTRLIKCLKVEQHNENWIELAKMCIEYYTDRTKRTEKLNEINELREKVIEMGESQKSYPVYTLISFSHWLSSSLSHVPNVGSLEGQDMPERTLHLHDAAIKAESCVRNRVPGLTPSSFDNVANSSILDALERNGKPVSPTELIQSGACIAWMFEVQRELALNYISIAQAREAFSYLIINWRVALRSASHLRIMQSINNLAYFCSIIKEQTYDYTKKVIDATLLNFLSTNPVIIRCITPVMENDEAAPRTPGSEKKHRKSKNVSGETTVDDVVTKMEELIICPDQKFHAISKSCGCYTCSFYKESSSIAAEYMFSYLLNRGFAQHAMEDFNKELVMIRERACETQQMMVQLIRARDTKGPVRGDEKDGKPRPPILLSEIFGICASQWLNGKLQRSEAFDDESEKVYATALKYSRYLIQRTTEQMLTISQLARQLRCPNNKQLSWMMPSEVKKPAKKTIKKAADLFRAVSPFGQRKKVEQVAVPLSTAEKALLAEEMRNDIMRFGHLLFREWRHNMFSYVGRTTTDPWLSAYSFSESSSIGSRCSVQMKAGKCRRGLVTFGNKEVFKKNARRIPEDMTLIQIAIGDDRNAYMIKIHVDRDPIIMPLGHHTAIAELVEKFAVLLKEDEQIAKNPGERTAEVFWEERKKVDARLGLFVEEVQNHFLGVAAHLFKPSAQVGLNGTAVARKMAEVSKNLISPGLAKELVHLTTTMKEQEWADLMKRFCQLKEIDEDTTEILCGCYARAREKVVRDKLVKNDKRYTFLVICPELSQFCWERLPVFADNPYVCRQISIHSLFYQLEAMTTDNKPMPKEIDLHNSYYILDPENNLGETKKRMMSFINKYDWQGAVGKAPEKNDIVTALEGMDAFLYIGHGSGSRVMSRSIIKRSKCKAVTFLMGCGSIRITPQGTGFDGNSILFDYVIANSPLIVGCLWTVTDGEIDRFLMKIIDDLVNDGSGLRQLAEAMHEARSNAKLKYLTSGAVTMYGCPTVSKVNTNYVENLIPLETKSTKTTISQQVLQKMTNQSADRPIDRVAKPALAPRKQPVVDSKPPPVSTPSRRPLTAATPSRKPASVSTPARSTPTRSTRSKASQPSSENTEPSSPARRSQRNIKKL